MNTQEKKGVPHEVSGKAFEYIIAAFGLVAALAWNDAIKALIEALVPIEKSSLVAQFVYALVVTILVVIFVRILQRKNLA